ncbi:uncharacterized protein LOC117107818 isoform X2 [Anneissia japonica]|uniref:uncharacterized protein LOC117107818 isoform X2 n=1 Tax=Anneissia japonica TaxID=1529436 RepID=UPI001425A786|nr:uncharacterized protein LOC117107818 isoform X2 [Anneissia japonica]
MAGLRRLRQCFETCDSDSCDALKEPVLTAVSDYSNLKAEEARYCKTSIKKKTSQNNYSDEIACKGKKRSQTMALKSCDKYQENTKFEETSEEETTDKLKDVVKKEDVSDYWTFEPAHENVRNWESTFRVLLKEINQCPNLDIVISDDKRMVVALVTSTGATIKFGRVELTIPEGALKEKTFVFIYMLEFTETPGSIPLCPEVMCGPPGLQFETYVTLTVELFRNLPVSTRSLSTKALMLCKQEPSDWKTISEADGSSFIKNNRSYTLTDHFTRFKTVLEETNSDGTGRKIKRLIEISLSERNVHGEKEILVEFRKNFQYCQQIDSVQYGYCDESSTIKIEVGDHQEVTFPHFAENLLNINNNFSAVSYSAPFKEIPIFCNFYLDESKFQMTPQNSELDTNQLYKPTIKKPQTNVNNICLKELCSKIDMEMNREFEVFLLENVNENEKKMPRNIELTVRRFLSENDENLQKLQAKLRECGMDGAADAVNAIPVNPARRPLPSTSTDDIQSLNSLASGNIFSNQGVVDSNSGCGPLALSYGVNRADDKGKCRPEEREQPGNDEEANRKKSEQDGNPEPTYENVKPVHRQSELQTKKEPTYVTRDKKN